MEKNIQISHQAPFTVSSGLVLKESILCTNGVNATDIGCFYMHHHFFRYDKALTAKSVRVCLSGNMCPLDTVVTMNSYFRASR